MGELGANLLAMDHICCCDRGKVLYIIQHAKIGVLIDIRLLC